MHVFFERLVIHLGAGSIYTKKSNYVIIVRIMGTCKEEELYEQ